MTRVIVGMSGGVDSSVAAHLLKGEGYDVRGLSFLMWEAGGEDSPSSCCSVQATEAAARAARSLGISHTTIDVRKDFREKVIEPFVKAYLSGLTPNPCILCNRFIKFPGLLAEASRAKADYISTGHYARVAPSKEAPQDGIRRSPSSRTRNSFLLKKGTDPKKDQSYVLYVLGQRELGRLLLPLGSYRKADVRKLARKAGLPSAESVESQDICFVRDNNYLAFIEQSFHLKTDRGPILDECGAVLGTHSGIYGYTVGQRKGLGISSSGPLYVTGIDIAGNALHVGARESARRKEFLVGELHWTAPLLFPPADGEKESVLEREIDEIRSFRMSVKVRSMMRDEPATLYMAGRNLQGVVRVVFDEPQWAPAPGQSAVFYKGETVVGGGIINRPV